MKRLLFVFGTRPEAIKLASVIEEFQKKSSFETRVCITAQHREMLDQVLVLFNIRPDYDLNIMKKGQDLFEITSSILVGMKNVFREYKPDIVFVHGDTTTSFVASLAAFYSGIPVAHIEAGLRTYNLYAPWPEEANRQLTARLVKYHFAPTERAKDNLIKESLNAEHIVVTGNTVIDTLFLVQEKLSSKREMEEVNLKLMTAGYDLSIRKNPILITGHRRENFGEGFKNICEAIKKLAVNNPSFDFVYPVHLNPNVVEPVYSLLSGIDNIYLIKPLEYESFVLLLSMSFLVLTDSGGIQEEAPSFGKPVLVMRDTTERPEAVEAGTVKLVGTCNNTIVESVEELIHNEAIYNRMARAHNPYGDGKAAKRIREYVEKILV